MVRRSAVAVGTLPGHTQHVTIEHKSTQNSNGDATNLPGLSSVDRALEVWRGRLTGGVSPIAYSLAGLDWFAHTAGAPGRQARLAAQAWRNATQLAARALASGRQDTDHDGLKKGNQRFASPAWQAYPFNLLAEAFLLSEQWWQQATSGVPGLSRHHEQMVSFVARQLLELASPSNYLWTNPEVLKATIEQRGDNLVRGAQLLAEDCQRLLTGGPAPGTDAFVPGESVAVTPGKVVYRNQLIELIQYEPATKTVHSEPVLIVPAWIMKYYILDLSPHNSLVKYLIDQGHTVFMISWHNPGLADRELSMEDYRELGVMAALDAVQAIVPDTRVHCAGYCIGGTLLSICAATMARDKDERLATVTLFAAETDFTEPGELGVFIDESQVGELQNVMRERGYLDTTQMAGAFQMLRPYELLWSRIVREYLFGERQLPNDLMAWNADGTRLPYRMHCEYLSGMFVRNDLFEGRYVAGGRPISLGDVRQPTFVVGTVRDHVAPWRSVYKLNLLAETELTFLLTVGGHNAGIVSEPGHAHRGYQVATRPAGAPYVDPDRWVADNPAHEGSWWPTWESWLAKRSSGHGAPPSLGAPALGYAAIADAPGTYVLEH